MNGLSLLILHWIVLIVYTYFKLFLHRLSCVHLCCARQPLYCFILYVPYIHTLSYFCTRHVVCSHAVFHWLCAPIFVCGTGWCVFVLWCALSLCCCILCVYALQVPEVLSFLCTQLSTAEQLNTCSPPTTRDLVSETHLLVRSKVTHAHMYVFTQIWTYTCTYMYRCTIHWCLAKMYICMYIHPTWLSTDQPKYVWMYTIVLDITVDSS